MSKSGVSPFLASFQSPWSDEVIRNAIAESRVARDEYDPISQTSNIPLNAGTARTYTGTKSGGPVYFSQDDDKVTDD